ncbi:MAG: hypothetical protein ABIR79_19840, partial [Candidatus Binatia bacterium]
HRFFLALLLNVGTRDDLLALVAERFPEQPPLATVMRWADELCETTEFGTALLDAEFPETQPDFVLAALRHFVEGGKKLPAALRTLGAAGVADRRTIFAQSSLAILLT